MDVVQVALDREMGVGAKQKCANDRKESKTMVCIQMIENDAAIFGLVLYSTGLHSSFPTLERDWMPLHDEVWLNYKMCTTTGVK